MKSIVGLGVNNFLVKTYFYFIENNRLKTCDNMKNNFNIYYEF